MARPLSFHLRPHRNSTSATSNSSSPSATVSTPSTTVTLGNAAQPPPSVSQQKQDAATVVAASRASIRQNTRSDWEYPPQEPESPLRIEDETRYVVRTEDPPTPSPSPEPPLYATVPTEKGPYSYQGPIDVGQDIEALRKRKRQEEREERDANEGLRIFEARRNAWTGAIQVQGRRRDWPEGLQWSRKEVLDAEISSDASSPDPSDDSDSTDGHISPSLPRDSQDQPIHSPTADASPTPPLSGPSSLSTLTSSSSRPPYITPLIPIGTPLLPPTHPTRALITPSAYPSIYSRVVVQGTSPRLPIPLPDIVASCVIGWKTEGEWPPKGNPGGPEPLAGRRRVRSGVKDGLGRGVRRVLRIVGRGEEGEGGVAGKGALEGLVENEGRGRRW
ncbi:MAG: hypothetical protein MMC23_009896 [Stictis urceolatum]|nr:hypothetical protein [Stictis urceolata]